MIATKNKFGLLNSYNDQPSLIENGNLYWHKDGLLHRDNDLPSMIMNNGDKYWYTNGNIGRLNECLPYIEKTNGDKYYLTNKFGCYKIISHLNEIWFNKNNEYHREDGPAYKVFDKYGILKYKYWYTNGKLERRFSAFC
jgi:hypothetical protein